MKSLMLCGVFASSLLAQRGTPIVPPRGGHLPVIAPNMRNGGSRGFGGDRFIQRALFPNGFRNGRGSAAGAAAAFGWGYPYYPALGGFDYADEPYMAAPEQQPQTIVVPMAMPEPPLPPLPPPRLVVNEYHWAEAPNAAPVAFSIVGTDGVTHQASMVWVEGATLHYNAIEGGARTMPLASVSRAQTERANAEKGLRLALP